MSDSASGESDDAELRLASIQDVEDVANLLTQLGYPCDRRDAVDDGIPGCVGCRVPAGKSQREESIDRDPQGDDQDDGAKRPPRMANETLTP